VRGELVILKQAFPATPPSVRGARRFVAEALADSPVDLVDDVQLMVSELTTNVIRHAVTNFDVTIHRTRGEILVKVTDHGSGLPTMRSLRPDAPDGRGLQIVDTLSSGWGVEDASSSGKTVWFSLPLTKLSGAGTITQEVLGLS
jgi:anti-sigma regulatory factor (Ser/Thr protein kinase)